MQTIHHACEHTHKGGRQSTEAKARHKTSPPVTDST